MLGFTQQSLHRSDLCNESSGCLIKVKSCFLSLRFNCIGSSVLRGRFITSVSKVAPTSMIACSVRLYILRNVLLASHHKGKQGLLLYLSRMSFDVRSSCSHDCPLTTRTCRYECSTALPRMELLGIPRITNTDDQDFLSQDSFQRTPFKTRRVSATCVVKQ